MRIIKHISEKRKLYSNEVTSVEEGKKEIKIKENNIKFYLRRNGNYVRRNKNDEKFMFVNTNDYDSIFEEWTDYCDYAYTSCGKNSKEREVIIVDCDDEDYGKKTLELFNETPITLNYQRIKKNGHSQTAIFIEKVFVKNPSLNRRTTCQSDIFTEEQWNFVTTYEQFLRSQEIVCSKYINNKTLIDVNRLYLSTVKLLNANFNGDLGFTGYCCQNPYSNADEGTTTWFNKDHKYKLGELFCLTLEHTVSRTLKVVRSKKNNTKTNTNKPYYEIIGEEKKEVNEELSKISKQINEAYKNSIDGAIFKYITELKNFTYRKGNKLTVKYALKAILNRKDITKDYAYTDIEEHVSNSVDYINKHFNPSLAGYTDKQRILSNSVRKVESLKTWFDIKRLKNKGYTHKQISLELGISTKTVQRLIKKEYEDFDIESLKENLSSIKKYRDYFEFLIRTVEKKLCCTESVGDKFIYNNKCPPTNINVEDDYINELVSCILAS